MTKLVEDCRKEPRLYKNISLCEDLHSSGIQMVFGSPWPIVNRETSFLIALLCGILSFVQCGYLMPNSALCNLDRYRPSPQHSLPNSWPVSHWAEVASFSSIIGIAAACLHYGQCIVKDWHPSLYSKVTGNWQNWIKLYYQSTSCAFVIESMCKSFLQLSMGPKC